MGTIGEQRKRGSDALSAPCLSLLCPTPTLELSHWQTLPLRSYPAEVLANHTLALMLTAGGRWSLGSGWGKPGGDGGAWAQGWGWGRGRSWARPQGPAGQ